jgi:hypothetical protein
MLEPSATRKVSQENWNSFLVCSIRTATVTGRSIMLSIHPAGRIYLADLTLVTCLPFVGLIFNCINKVLIRHNIKTVGLLPNIASFLQPVKDDLSLKTPGVYSTFCECGKVYIGQNGCSTETRLKDHHQHIIPYHPDKSAVGKHSINLSQHTQFQDTIILDMKSRCMEYIIREAAEFELHPDNMNREKGFSLRKSWKHLLQTLKE